MNSAVLRGFDFPGGAIHDRLRFCNPLLSFDDSKDAPIFIARQLDWRARPDKTGGSFGNSLTRISNAEIQSFATIIPRAIEIDRNRGVLVMGDHFVSELRTALIAIKSPLVFTILENIRCRIAITSVACFASFATAITNRAYCVFDEELGRSSDSDLSHRAVSALFILRKCSAADPLNTAIRELASAHVTGQEKSYDRLLIRYSLEMQVTSGELRARVYDHIDKCEKARSPTDKFSVSFDNSVARGPIRANDPVAAGRTRKTHKVDKPASVAELPASHALPGPDVYSNPEEVISYVRKIQVKGRGHGHPRAWDLNEDMLLTLSAAKCPYRQLTEGMRSTHTDALLRANKMAQYAQK